MHIEKLFYHPCDLNLYTSHSFGAGRARPGFPLGIQPVVQFQDDGGRPVSAWQRFGVSGVWVRAINSAGGVVPLRGSSAVGLGADGSARWTDLQVNPAGRCMRLEFGAVGELGAAATGLRTISWRFDVPLGPPDHLAVGQQPTNETAGIPFLSQVTVIVLDGLYSILCLCLVDFFKEKTSCICGLIQIMNLICLDTLQPRIEVQDAGGNVLTSDSGGLVSAVLLNEASWRLQVK